MKKSNSRSNATRIALFCVVSAALVVGMAQWSSVNVSANHPVFVEGNCDSPIPGTTIVTVAGTCGDYDGDGRIGTAEDTDGADRIFGTLRAAIGPGTGAAAGTGANHNGKIIIVASGRFAESLFIGNTGFVVGEGVANPGNTTIEAAPGVDAVIDAILQGDPAGGNLARTAGTGIQTIFTATDRVTTLRNLEIRNWLHGITIRGNSRVHIDNCRLEGNLGNSIIITDSSRVTITNSQIIGSGRRTGVGDTIPAPGNGILVEASALARIAFTNISHSAAAGVNNTTGAAGNVIFYGVTTFFNNPNLANNGAISAPDPNFAQ